MMNPFTTGKVRATKLSLPLNMYNIYKNKNVNVGETLVLYFEPPFCHHRVL